MSKSGPELWHALLLIIPVTFGWIWFFAQEGKSAKRGESPTVLAHECKKHGHIRRER